MSERPFFIGYAPVPRGLKPFLWIVSAILVVAAGVLGFAIGSAQDDPGDGRGYGRQTVTGTIELTPLPVLHVSEGTDRIPPGRTLMLSGQGKNGAVARATKLEGQMAMASGLLLKRGEIEMLQLRSGQRGLKGADEAGIVPEPVDLGRWKLAGEICDGKCLSGIMRPGRGLSHRACANLCIQGGIPPVFVSTQAIEDQEFLMLSGPGNSALPQAIYDYVALYISAEGRVRRHGDLLVFELEPETVEVLQ